MGFTDPFTGLTPYRKLTREEIMRALRIDVAAELDAISLYQAHIDAIDDEKVKLVIAHIRDEEKEHMAEFVGILNYLDGKQAEEFASEDVAALEKGQLPPDIAATPIEEETTAGAGTAALEEAPAIAPDGGPQFTVGSLLGQDQ